MITILTADDGENVEWELDHVQQLVQSYLKGNARMTCTGRVGSLLSMSAAVNQLKATINTVCAKLKEYILDPYSINYFSYAQNVETLLKNWHEGCFRTPFVFRLNPSEMPVTVAEDIVSKEDTYYDMNIELNGMDSNEFRIGLIKNAPMFCGAIESGLECIARSLRGIVADFDRLEHDVALQNEKLRHMESIYEAEKWDEDKKRLADDVLEYVWSRKDSSEKETFQFYLKKLSREATAPHKNKLLAELNATYLKGGNRGSFIVSHRNSLSFDDVRSHFCFVKSHQAVSEYIEMCDLSLAADDDYRDLFVNKAAQEIAFLLAPTIGMYVDFRYHYHYAALQMAMMDLGLIFRGRNGAQMMQYVNEYFLRPGAIKDQTTLTQRTAKLLGRPFGAIDENNFTETNMSLLDFRNMKDYYWLCHSIINKVMNVDIRKMGFAPYLLEEHANTPPLTDYRNKDGESALERLQVLKSAFHKESIFCGGKFNTP